jgi:CMP-N-acetylneuraminic acid synthetase
MNDIVYSLICARGGSKGIKNKNIKNFCGKPLIHWTINQSLKNKMISKTFLSTDSIKIKNICKKLNVEIPFLRKKKLSKDRTPEWIVWQDFLNYLIENKIKLPDILIILPVTSPLRSEADISNCIKQFKKKKSDILITATEAKRNPDFNMIEKKKDNFFKVISPKSKKIHNRQDAKKVYDVCTVAYVSTASYILNNENMFQGNVDMFEIPKNRSIDIDDKFDFKIASYLFQNKINY